MIHCIRQQDALFRVLLQQAQDEVSKLGAVAKGKENKGLLGRWNIGQTSGGRRR